MKIIYVAPLILACVMSGCSFYDVTTLAADAAFGTGVFSDADRHKGDWNGLWNPETSECIRNEKELREFSRQLDAIEDGKASIILPTGEHYPLKNRSVRDQPLPGPTALCLSRFSD